MNQIINSVQEVNSEFRQLILESNISSVGFTLDQYTRYLQMQYHLVKDVQKNFFQIAAHSEIFSKGGFRKFLLDFGVEEGPHYKMAERDLKSLDRTIGESPLDVRLWWCYFEKEIENKPLKRLGGTCILENIGSAVGDLVDSAIAKSGFLNKGNTTFLILHKHEVVNHGELILSELDKANLSEEELRDVHDGLLECRPMVLRIFYWVLYGENHHPLL